MTAKWSTDSAVSRTSVLSFSAGDTKVDATAASGGRLCQGDQFQDSGKVYGEFKMFDSGTSPLGYVGISDDGINVNTQNVGGMATSWAIMANGNSRTNNSDQGATGTGSFAFGDTVMIAVDLTGGKMWFGKNGTWQGDPAAGTGEEFNTLSSSSTGWRWGCLAVQNWHGWEIIAPGSWTYTAPSGFSALESAPSGDGDALVELIVDGVARNEYHHPDGDALVEAIVDGLARNKNHYPDGDALLEALVYGVARNATHHVDVDLLLELTTDGVSRIATVRADGDLLVEGTLDAEGHISLHRADGDLLLELALDADGRGAVKQADGGALLELTMNGLAAIKAVKTHEQSYNLWVGITSTHPWSDGLFFEHEHLYSIPGFVGLTHDHLWTMQAGATLSKEHTQKYRLVDFTEASRTWVQPYAIRDNNDAISVSLGSVYATIDSNVVDVELAEIAADENGFAWTCRIQVPQIANFFLFERDDAFSVTFLGEVYQFIVDDVLVSRNASSAPSLVIAGISPTATLARPRATSLTQEWLTPINASTVADDVTGLSVSWNILDWQIPGGSLAVTDSTPIEVVQLVARAAGGVVETLPDGTLNVRYKWPVSVPSFPTASVDQILTDAADNLTVRGSLAKAEETNEIAIRDRVEDSFRDQVEFEPDGDSNVRGKIRVYSDPLRTVSLSTTGGSWVSVVSRGTVARSVTEEIEIFNGEGRTRYPISSITSIDWNDTDLGNLTFTARKSEVRATTPADGNTMAVVTYVTSAQEWSVSSPYDEEVQFLVNETGPEVTAGTAILAKRDGGGKVGEDIVDPLVSNTTVATARGRQELDDKAGIRRNEALQILHRAGLRTGQLIEVSDTLTGETWRAKTISVAHQVRGPEALTTLRAIRPL